MTPTNKARIMDDYGLYTAALSSLNNSLANGANMIIASETSRQDRKFSREMSDLAWQRNLESWNMQNEYNLPANQYARQLEGLRVNGLNPNLVYGSSSSIGGAAGSVSPYKFEGYHSTAVPRSALNDPVQSLLSTKLLQTQVAAQEASNRLINARADNEEARHPGILSQSEESAARWRYKLEHPEEFAESVQGSMALEYWTGRRAESEAKIADNKYHITYFDREVAEWLNDMEVPGLDMTYRQYMEMCKAYLPGVQYAKFRADIFNIASEIAYRAKQGRLVDAKIEYQGYVNRLAKYGRSLGNSWVNILLSGLEMLFGGDSEERNKRLHELIGFSPDSVYTLPPTP